MIDQLKCARLPFGDAYNGLESQSWAGCKKVEPLTARVIEEARRRLQAMCREGQAAKEARLKEFRAVVDELAIWSNDPGNWPGS